MDVVSLVVGLLSGAAGGNIAGKVMNSNMGTLGRSLTGIIGGTGFAALAQYIPGLEGLFQAPTDGAMSVSGILSSLVAGGAGGGILTAILGKVMGGK